jgi:hypothetical protein
LRWRDFHPLDHQLASLHDFKYLAIWVEVAACRFIETAKAAEMAKRIAGLC